MASKKAPAKKSAAKKSPAKKKAPKKAGAKHANFDEFICNVIPSKGTENDWQLADSLAAGSIGAVPRALPTAVDLRAPPTASFVGT